MTPRKNRFNIVVIGAGAFGGWTALELVRRGAHVTLIDAWSPGHARASSGGETRIIRATYGSRAIYTRMARRALDLWRQHDAKWRTHFFRHTGALWMFGKDDGLRKTSSAALQTEGLAIEELTPADARRRYPQIDFAGVSSILLELDAGYLLARAACAHIVERVIAEGGAYRQASVATPVHIKRGRAAALRMTDGSFLRADAFVFACGPWLGPMFPDVIGRRIAPTRQEVYYFGTPPGDTRFDDARLPVWLDVGRRLMYGIPGHGAGAFKVADDTSGPLFDPTTGDRNLTQAGVQAARRFLRKRFPALAGAPLVSAEVCQYEATPDANFIVDVHPKASNVLLVGGGSGHGFKMGPVIGEMAAAIAFGDARPDAFFGLGRFAGPKDDVMWEKKWS